MENIRKLIVSMFRVGLIGFGGGNALIPILGQSSVEENGLVTQEEYEEDVVVASITPGALPVEIAGGIGRRSAGCVGLLVGSVAMALPGVILTLLITSVISILNVAVLMQIRYLAVGVTAFIGCLLTEYIFATIRQGKENKNLKEYLVVIMAVFVLTCGKNLFRILTIETDPLFSLATIHIFVMAFFLLLYLGEQITKKKIIIASILCAMFVLCKGSRRIIPWNMATYIIETLMLILSVYELRKTSGNKVAFERKVIRRTFQEIGWIFFPTVIFMIGSMLITNSSLLYLWNGFLSSLMSFGGGDAYLTVADGLFVRTGLIDESDFYVYLVSIVNILPGSILCKTLSGIGYFLGFSQHGKVWEGVVIAVAGFFVSLLASCGVFDLIGCFYGAFRNFYFVKGIKKWIRPIVSGLMLTVILSLAYQNKKLGAETILGATPLILMAVIYVIDILMVYRMKLKNGNVVFLSALCSFIVCNLMGR